MSEQNRKVWGLRTSNIILLVALAFLVLIVIYFRLKGLGGDSIPDFLFLLLGALIETSVVLLVVGLVYDKWTKENYISEMKDVVSNTMLFSKENIRNYSQEKIKNGIRAYIQAIIGDKKGELVYHDALEPYLTNDFSWRENYSYHIAFNEDANYKFDSISMTEKDYRTVYQDFRYKKVSESCGDDAIKICFVFDYNLLDSLMAEENIFFREHIPLSDKDRDELIGIFKDKGDEAIKEFIEKTMCLKAYNIPCDQEYTEDNLSKFDTFEIEHSHDYSCIYIIYNAKEKLISNVENQLFVRLNFRLPYSRSATQFLLTIAELADSPKMTFQYTPEMKNLKKYAFNVFRPNMKKNHIESRHNLIEYSFDTWVFPITGIVISWGNS